MVKPYVVYWNDIPTPYMVDRFNALAERNKLNFEAWFSERYQAGGRDWRFDESQWRFRFRFLPGIQVGTRKLAWPGPVFSRRPPDLLVAFYSRPDMIFALLLARKRGIRAGLWCQVTPERWFKRRPWKEQLKRYVFRHIDFTLGSGRESQAYAIGYGMARERAFQLRHAIDIESLQSEHRCALEEREAIRLRWGLKGTVFLYVGRLWWGKGLNHLLDAFSYVQREYPKPVSLVLAGSGPDEAGLRARCAELGLERVVFTGFLQKHELPRCYAAADIFVFPTLGDPYGLVVDEAMACGLPVIASQAAGEIRERIEHEINGLLVAPENTRDLADAMHRLAADPALCREMGKYSIQRVQGHTPQRWAADFEHIVFGLLDKKRGSTG